MANDIFTEANAEALESAENVNVPATEEQKKDHTGLIIGIGVGVGVAGGYIIHRIRKNRKNAADAAKYQELTKALKEQNIDVIDVDFVEVTDEPKKETAKPKSNNPKKKNKKKKK